MGLCLSSSSASNLTDISNIKSPNNNSSSNNNNNNNSNLITNKYTSKLDNINQSFNDNENIIIGPSIHTNIITSVLPIAENLLFTGSLDNSINLYNYKTKEILVKYSHESSINRLVYSSVNKILFSSSRDKSINLWNVSDLATTSPISTLLGHTLVITGLDLSNDNKYLCSGSRDYSIRIWDIETSKELCKNEVQLNMVTSIKWLDNFNILQTSEDLVMKIWDSRNAKIISNFPTTAYFPLDSASSIDNNDILTAMNGFDSHGCMVQHWDRRMLKLVKEFNGHEHAVNSVCFLPILINGKRHLASCSKDGYLRIWDFDSGECIQAINLNIGALTSVRPFADSNIVAIGSTKESIVIIEIFVDGNFRVLAKTQEGQ